MQNTLPPPSALPVDHLLPTDPLLMMGAGPTPMPHVVAVANSRIINHLGPTMNAVVDGVKDLARYAFQTQNLHVLGISGPASSAMEMTMANLLWPGRRALVFVTGTFSGRLADMAEGIGAEVTRVKCETARPATAEMARKALAAGRYDLVALVQGETSCGVRNAELPEIARLAREHGALVMADAVCTLTTMPLPMDAWGIDVVVTGGQKGLGAVPGVSLIAFSAAAWTVVEARPRPMPHWCLDAQRAWRFWGDHQYHYTAPVPGVLATYEALRLVAEETLEVRFARHQRCSRALQTGIEHLGLSLLVPPECRLDAVLAIRRPEGIDAIVLRKAMEADFRVEIAGAFGLDIVRIGQMGEQCRGENVLRTLYALGESLRRLGAPVDVAAGMAAASARLSQA